MTFENLWVINGLAILAHLALIWVLQVMGGIQFPFARALATFAESVFALACAVLFLAKMAHLILASSSPRRRELCDSSDWNLKFTVQILMNLF